MTVTEVEYCSVVKEVETQLKKEDHTEELKAAALEDKPKPFKREIVWFNAIGFLLLHLGAIYGFVYGVMHAKFLTYPWTVILSILAGESITAGAHRLWSHRSYKAVLPLKVALLIGQTMAGQNCLWVWVRDHRQHHKFSDTDADPHNANRGFFFSHMGWLMCRKHPEVIRRGKEIDMSDLEADPWVMFQKNHYKKLYVIFAIMLPVWIPWYFWGESLWVSFFACYLLRFILSVNATWMVNSYAHMFGTKPYTQDIAPVETPLVSLLALGEGWHNYHHTFPWDYRAAEYGHTLNFTTTILDFFAKYGWVYDRRFASDEMIRHRVMKRGDGTHPKWGTAHIQEQPDPIYS